MKFQAETLKSRNENNELRITQTRNNSELTQIITNYEDEINKMKNHVYKLRAENASLKEDCDKLHGNNEELLELINQNNGDVEKVKIAHEKEIGKLKTKLNKSRNEFESTNSGIQNYIDELSELKCRQSRFLENQQRQL